jgi:predicted nucleotidyltransferase
MVDHDTMKKTRGGVIRNEPVMSGLMASDPILAEIVRRLIEAYSPDRIYLFGSKARGDSSPDSDYDLLIVVPDEAPPERRRSRLAYDRLWGTGAAADVLVWTRTQFESRTHLAASLPATVLREGNLLHGA